MASMMACNSKTGQENTAANSDFAQTVDTYYEERLKFFPIEATFQGDNRYNDLLPNSISQEFLDQTKAFYTATLEKIKAFDREKLSDQDKISYDILKRELELQLDQFKFHLEYVPFSQFDGLTLSFGQLGSGAGAQPFKTVKDYDDWLKRVSAFQVWGDTAIANFRERHGRRNCLAQKSGGKDDSANDRPGGDRCHQKPFLRSDSEPAERL
jgi:uncharacterized protein (DUF885 family)